MLGWRAGVVPYKLEERGERRDLKSKIDVESANCGERFRLGLTGPNSNRSELECRGAREYRPSANPPCVQCPTSFVPLARPPSPSPNRLSIVIRVGSLARAASVRAQRRARRAARPNLVAAPQRPKLQLPNVSVRHGKKISPSPKCSQSIRKALKAVCSPMAQRIPIPGQADGEPCTSKTVR